ncbi:MAG TPA: hypothetical protein VJ938_12450 [Acidimicrobiia bacterium]|nr:hypothetical protein [Acidimicrobiia bacterium]
MTRPSDDVTWEQASARRLHRSGITGRLPLTPSGVVSAMVAAHSQVASAGELAVALRCDGIVDDVRRALWEEHSLIRTYGPRGRCTCFPPPT